MTENESANRVAISLVIAVTLAACSPDGAGPGDISAGVLEGIWRTSCEPFGKNGRHGMVSSVEFADGKMRAALQAFDRPDCRTRTFHTTYEGRYTALPDGDGSWLLDHSVLSITLEADSQSVVDWYNDETNEDGCGLESWELNVPRDITGRTCRPIRFPEAGATLYDRVSVLPGAITFGNFPLNWEAVSESLRPERENGLTFTAVPG